MCVLPRKNKDFHESKNFHLHFRYDNFILFWRQLSENIPHTPQNVSWRNCMNPMKIKKRRNFTKCAKTFDIDFSSLHLKKLISIVFTVKTLSLIYHHPVCHNCHPFLLTSGMRENMQMVVKITNTKQWIVWNILCWPFCNPA